jgi:hypothetical protein
MPGYQIGFLKPKDYSFERAFWVDEGISKRQWITCGRDERAKKVPVFYQGQSPLCTICTMGWVACWFGYDTATVLTTAAACKSDYYGSVPRDVMDDLRKAEVFPNYYYVENPGDKDALLTALKESPLAVGLAKWPFAHGQDHMMVLLDLDPENGDYICVNWNNPAKLDIVTLPKDTVFIEAICFSAYKPKILPTMPLLSHVWQNIKRLCHL